jgi:hypothetical protein
MEILCNSQWGMFLYVSNFSLFCESESQEKEDENNMFMSYMN